MRSNSQIYTELRQLWDDLFDTQGVCKEASSVFRFLDGVYRLLGRRKKMVWTRYGCVLENTIIFSVPGDIPLPLEMRYHISAVGWVGIEYENWSLKK